VTEAQAAEIETEWDKLHRASVPVEKRQGHEQEKARLTKEWGRIPSDADVTWSLLNKEMVQRVHDRDWGLYRNALLHMGEFLEAESRMAEALTKYLEVSYLDVNDPSNCGGWASDPALLKEFPPFRPYKDGLAPGVMARIASILANGETSDDGERMFMEVAAKLHHALRLPVPPERAWRWIRASLKRWGE
jgi:hypothetical protein